MRNAELEEKIVTRAKNAAYRLLTYRPRSRRELGEKLRDKEFPEELIEAVVDHCARLGYLDDRKFATQWASSRVRLRSFGRRRIERELRGKGVDRETISAALEAVFSPDTELGTAREAAEKKMKTLTSADRETRRRRLAGFLERKGFSFEIIRSVLRETE
jgi:regulatory protein